MRARWLALLACATATCVPDLGPGDSLVTSPRLLALRADPAEANPGTKVTFTPFVVGSAGAVPGAVVAMSFCTAPRPLTDDNIVSDACLGSSSLVVAGAGAVVAASTPANGCSLFGPDTPPGDFRPTDPDSTGGYYQPLRIDHAGADASFALVRIHCDLANASATAATAFAASYTMNQNPTLLPVTATLGGSPATLSAIPASARVVFTSSWPDSSAETFAYFDPASQSVTTQREAMQVVWYSTVGAFDTESTGRASDDLATSSDDTWTAPALPAAGQIFVVLRDSRGGVAFATVEVDVTP